MANKITDTLIKLNHQGKSLREISDVVGFSWQQVWSLLHKDKRYKPGKRGFARLSKEAIKAISSKGGFRANKLGVTYRWDRKGAIAASKKSLIKRKRS